MSACARHKGLSVNDAYRLRVATTARLVGVVAVAAGSMPASWASGEITPYAAENIDHNSNIFALQGNAVGAAGTNANSVGATSYLTRAGADGTYKLDQQEFFGTLEARHIIYGGVSDLNHNEYLFAGGLRYKLGPAVDGIVQYTDERRMVQFTDVVDSTALIVETDKMATASFNVNITPDWRIESQFRDHVLDSPRAEVAALSLKEDSLHEGFRYIGVTNLSAGIDAEYLTGKYRDDPLALSPTYHQSSEYVAANYKISGLTNFSGALGYTSRSDPTNTQNTGSTSGVTGNITYNHQVSGKTSFNLGLSRNLATYLTTGGNEVDTTASIGGVFKATFKTTFTASYNFTNSKFAQTPIPGQPGTVLDVERTDHYQTANFQVTYQMLHWLSVRPYVTYQKRNSNIPFNQFNSTSVGIELIARPPVPLR
jgi:hypothetical protein